MEKKEFEKYVIIYVFLLIFIIEQLHFDVDTKKKHRDPHIPEGSRTSVELIGIPTESISITASPSPAPEEWE